MERTLEEARFFHEGAGSPEVGHSCTVKFHKPASVARAACDEAPV